jgi:hypothetical protein
MAENNTILLFYTSGGQMSKIDFMGAKIKILADLVSWEESVSLLLPALRGYL